MNTNAYHMYTAEDIFKQHNGKGRGECALTTHHNPPHPIHPSIPGHKKSKSKKKEEKRVY